MLISDIPNDILDRYLDFCEKGSECNFSGVDVFEINFYGIESVNFWTRHV